MVSEDEFLLSVVGAALEGVGWPVGNKSTVGTEHVLNPWKHLCSLGTHLCLHLPRRKQTGLVNREQRMRFHFVWQRENSQMLTVLVLVNALG